MSEKQEVTFDEIMHALALLEDVTGCQYEVRLKSDQWATLNMQNNDSNVTTFQWERDNKNLSSRILEYIVDMSKNHLKEKLEKLNSLKRVTESSIEETSKTLKALSRE